jgi:hypothetical protein
MQGSAGPLQVFHFLKNPCFIRAHPWLNSLFLVPGCPGYVLKIIFTGVFVRVKFAAGVNSLFNSQKHTRPSYFNKVIFLD